MKDCLKVYLGVEQVVWEKKAEVVCVKIICPVFSGTFHE